MSVGTQSKHVGATVPEKEAKKINITITKLEVDGQIMTQKRANTNPANSK